MFRWLWIALATVGLHAQGEDFDALMGKGTDGWRAIATQEDRDRLSFFKNCFESAEAKEGRIPRVFHFIWLGPKPFPAESVENVRGWIESHPGWSYKFWTDKERALPDPRMEFVLVDQVPAGLEELYYRADNYAERAAVLCDAILMAEGGVYLDHDLVCVKPLDMFQQGYDFFCGLEPLEGSLLSSSIRVGTHLIGSVPGHPILKETIDWLINNWQRVEVQFPGKGNQDILYRMQHRVLRALNHGVELGVASEGFNSLVAPAFYFSEASEPRALYARHTHAMSWKKQETDQKLVQSFEGIRSKLSAAFLWVCGLGVLNVVLGLWVIKLMWAIRKRAA